MAKALVPSIERRLATWLEVRRQEGETAASAGPTITLSREYGCEAFPVSEHLVRLFRERHGRVLTIFDRALIERVSEDDGILGAVLSRLDSSTLIGDILAPLVPQWKSHEKAFTRLAEDILTLAKAGDAVIVGRGSAVVAARLDNCFHFRLEAPEDFRVASIARRLGLDEAEARRQVEEMQRTRARFVEHFLHCNISDSRHYHAVFNNARCTAEEIAESILALVTAAA